MKYDLALICIFIMLFLGIGSVCAWFSKRYIRLTTSLLCWICCTGSAILFLLSNARDNLPHFKANIFLTFCTVILPAATTFLVWHWISIGIYCSMFFSGHLLGSTIAAICEQFMSSGDFFALAHTAIPSYSSTTSAYRIWWFFKRARIFGFLSKSSSLFAIFFSIIVALSLVILYVKSPNEVVVFALSFSGHWLIAYALIEIAGLVEGAVRGEDGMSKRKFFVLEKETWISCLMFLTCMIMAVGMGIINFRREKKRERERNVEL